MRMRRRNNLAPRMEACEAVWIHDPEALRGNWRSLMPGCRELRVEVGCGKGKFTVETAEAEPDVLLIAIERAGIAAPSRCRSGECGWCRSRLLSGDVFVPAVTDGRRGADKDFGYIHPCSSFPLSDVVLEVPGQYQSK